MEVFGSKTQRCSGEPSAACQTHLGCFAQKVFSALRLREEANTWPRRWARTAPSSFFPLSMCKWNNMGPSAADTVEDLRDIQRSLWEVSPAGRRMIVKQMCWVCCWHREGFALVCYFCVIKSWNVFMFLVSGRLFSTGKTSLNLANQPVKEV